MHFTAALRHSLYSLAQNSCFLHGILLVFDCPVADWLGFESWFVGYCALIMAAFVVAFCVLIIAALRFFNFQKR